MNTRRKFLTLFGASVASMSGCSSSSDSEPTPTVTSTEESPSADFDSFTITIDSRATFLRKDSTDSRTPDPAKIDLENRGISTGDEIEFDVSGRWANDSSEYGEPDNCRSNGVFSRSGELRGIEKLNRVPGAIDAGEDVDNTNTYESNEPTDIPEDFKISYKEDNQCVRQNTVTVPERAEYLFIGVRDSAYHDNRGELTIEIRPA